MQFADGAVMTVQAEVGFFLQMIQQEFFEVLSEDSEDGDEDDDHDEDDPVMSHSTHSLFGTEDEYDEIIVEEDPEGDCEEVPMEAEAIEECD